MTVKQTTTTAIVMVLDAMVDQEDIQHAQKVVDAFREDLRDLGEYNAYKLLIRRIVYQRKMARGAK
jgi:hypothetical protein